jgi:hypothetical protein
MIRSFELPLYSLLSMTGTPRFYINLFRIKIASFHFFGIVGIIAGCVTGIIFAIYLRIPLWIAGIICLTCVFQLFIHTWIQKIITGKENMVYFRHEIFILLFCTIILWSIGQPIKPVLDATVLCIGTGLFFGRIGCYNAGCCHGRPCKIGVKYSQQHISSGFPLYLKGVKIFPITLIESFFVGIIILVSVWFILNNYPAGTILIWYTVSYGFSRFILEFFRGDTERPYWYGFSEAQWTTVVLFITTGVLSWFNWLPFYWGHFIAIAALIIAMLLIYVIRMRQSFSAHKIVNPGHVKEIALALTGIEPIQYPRPLPERKVVIPMVITSLGLKISSGIVQKEMIRLFHYTISASDYDTESKKAAVVNSKIANTMARLIQTLKHAEISFQIRKGKPGVYHIIFGKCIEG